MTANYQSVIEGLRYPWKVFGLQSTFKQLESEKNDSEEQRLPYSPARTEGRRRSGRLPLLLPLAQLHQGNHLKMPLIFGRVLLSLL